MGKRSFPITMPAQPGSHSLPLCNAGMVLGHCSLGAAWHPGRCLDTITFCSTFVGGRGGDSDRECLRERQPVPLSKTRVALSAQGSHGAVAHATTGSTPLWSAGLWPTVLAMPGAQRFRVARAAKAGSLDRTVASPRREADR